MKLEEWANAGPPMLEQDAEYFRELLGKDRVAANIQRSEDEAEIASGYCYLVQVEVRNLAHARQVRARFFSDREPTSKDDGAWHWGKRELIGAGAATGGCLLGIPVALIFKGGAFMAVLAGGALSLSAMLMTLVLTMASFGAPKVQNPGTPATHTHIVSRKDPTDRRRD